jgi:hypothetical protein
VAEAGSNFHFQIAGLTTKKKTLPHPNKQQQPKRLVMIKNASNKGQ